MKFNWPKNGRIKRVDKRIRWKHASHNRNEDGWRGAEALHSDNQSKLSRVFITSNENFERTNTKTSRNTENWCQDLTENEV